MKLFRTLALALIALDAVAQGPDEPLIKTGTQEVMLDVVVRDKHGHLVNDLKPGDLKILDNGVERKVQSFRLLLNGEMTASPGTAAERPKAFDPLQQIRLVTLVFNRLDLNARRLAHAAATDLLKNEFPQNVYMSVFALGDNLQALQPFTNDRAMLRKAVDRATSGTYSEFIADSKRIEVQMKQMLGPATDGGSTGEQVQGADNAEGAMARMMLNMLQSTERSELGQAGRSAIWGLMSAVEGQTKLLGRKSILLFSTGLGVPQGMEEPWKTLISTANRFNVTFYSIDARGLEAARANDAAVDGLKDAASASRASAMTGAGTVTPAMANGLDTAMNAGQISGESALADLAQSTGGFLISNSNDFREGLRKVSEDIESYYEVTYNPQISEYDGSYRKIEVRSLRAGLHIQARAGYFALPASWGNNVILSPYEIPLMRALNESPLPHSFDFQSAGLHFRGRRDQSACSVVLDIPLANITLRQAGGQSPYEGHLAYLAMVKDTKGEVVEKFRGDVPLAEAAEQMQASRNSHFIFTRNLTLAAGRYTLEAAVIDRTDNRISARKSGFVMPAAPPSKLGISSVVLVRSVRDRWQTPSPDDAFQIGDKVITPSLSPVTKDELAALRFYMMIYPDQNNANKPELVMNVSRNGTPVGGGSLILSEPDASGRIRYIAAASSDKMEPGNYQAEFFVMQGTETARETVTFTLN
jgi:VWFA-related protein